MHFTIKSYLFIWPCLWKNSKQYHDKFVNHWQSQNNIIPVNYCKACAYVTCTVAWENNFSRHHHWFSCKITSEGGFTWHWGDFRAGATFAPGRVHSSSLSWLYICLHDTTIKCHAGASRPGVSSPRLSPWGENFTLVRDFAMVSCKREPSTRSSGKSVCR